MKKRKKRLKHNKLESKSSSIGEQSKINHLFFAAGKHQQAGNIAEAESIYRQILKEELDHADSLHQLGLMANQTGQLDQAVHFINKAIECNPNSPVYFCNLGIILSTQGNFQKAISVLRQAITLKSDLPEAYFNLANALTNIGDQSEAIPLYNKAIAYNPDFLDAYKNLGIVLNRAERHNEAIEIFHHLLANNPDDPGNLNNLGFSYYCSGDLQKAIDVCRQAVKMKPDFPVAYNTIGLAYYKMGDINKAVEQYKNALEFLPEYKDALNNLGLAYCDLLMPEKAVACYEKFLKSDPNCAQVYFNLGIALLHLDKVDESIMAIQRGLAIQPDNSDALCNIATILFNLGKLSEAQAFFDRAIQCNPDKGNYHCNLAVFHFAQGNPAEAVSFCRNAIVLEPANLMYWQQFSSCLEQIHAPQTDTLFENDLKKCLAKDGIRRTPLVPNAVKILKKKATFKDAISVLDTEKENGLAEKIQIGHLDILHNQLLLLLLKNTIITDLILEKLLTKIRRCILGLVIGKQLEDHDDSLYEFVCALALQCWSNEYVYVESNAETKWIAQLKYDIEQSLASSDNPPLFNIALLGSYMPLHQLSGARKLISCSDFQIPCLKEFIVRQIQEPFEEQNIRDEIREISAIQDKVSKSVRSQYEENPYPRWNHIAQTGEPSPLVLKLRRLFPHYDPGAFSVSSSPKVLIAGCGTGREAIQCSLSFSGTRILAVDLSLASLAYAIRKARYLNISNIEFRHGDILGLVELDSQFDVIHCSGVLHHMRNPMEGWKVLVDLLKPNGFMQIALYSEIARKSIVAARKFIAEHGHKATIEGIRQCRQDVSQLPENHPAHKVTLAKDFYSTSECRDLLFHVQEHRFTIGQLEQAFGELDLEFLGFFQDDPRMMKNYRERFPKDLSANSLENWNRFEIENPDTFIGMYKFWVKKK